MRYSGKTIGAALLSAILLSIYLIFQFPQSVFEYPGNPRVTVTTKFSRSVLNVEKGDRKFQKEIQYEHIDFSKLIRVDFDEGVYLFYPERSMTCSPSACGVSNWFEAVLVYTNWLVFKNDRFGEGKIDPVFAKEIANSADPKIRQQLMDSIVYIELGKVHEVEWRSLKEFKNLSRVMVTTSIVDQDIPVIAKLNASTLDLRNSDFELSDSSVLSSLFHIDNVILPEKMRNSVSGAGRNVKFAAPFID